MENREPSTRQLKVAREVQRDLAEIIRGRGMAFFQGAMVTVSEVRISPDFSSAKVFVSVFPSGKQQDVMHILEENMGAIRGEMGRKIGKQIRIVPELTFFIDNSLDYAEHIEELLRK